MGITGSGGIVFVFQTFSNASSKSTLIQTGKAIDVLEVSDHTGFTAGSSKSKYRPITFEIMSMAANTQTYSDTIFSSGKSRQLIQDRVLSTNSIIDETFACKNLPARFKGADKLKISARLVGFGVPVAPGTIPDKDAMAAINKEIEKYGYLPINATAIARPKNMIAGKADEYVCVAINCQYFKGEAGLDYGRKTVAFLVSKDADEKELASLFLLVGGITSYDQKNKPHSNGVIFGNAEYRTGYAGLMRTHGIIPTKPFLEIDDILAGVLPSFAPAKGFALQQNYPNPFNPVTSIPYKLEKSAKVTLKVYNVAGQEVASLVNERQGPGEYAAQFDGSNLPSGTYFYRLTLGDKAATGKMSLIK